ncbi:MAG: hypothetical protein SNH27_12875 [Rikenellaceae bacterium]
MDLRKECVEFVSNLHSVNTLLLRLLTSDVSFSELCKAIDFYNANKDCIAFEAISLNLTFEDNDDLKLTIFSSILREIFIYSDLYKKTEERLSEFYPSDLFNNDIAVRIHKTEGLIAKSSEIGRQITTILQSDIADDDDSFILHRIKETELRDLQIQHRALIEELNGRYESYFEDVKLHDIYDVKIFYLLNILMVSIELVVSKYAPKELFEKHLKRVRKAQLERETGMDEPALFDMNIISSAYNICNNEQFEEISELDFYHEINNPSKGQQKLKIRKSEMMRVCYLIHLLSERLEEPLRTQWREQILGKLEISTSYYKSKYRNAVSGDASVRSSAFANNMRAVFI